MTRGRQLPTGITFTDNGDGTATIAGTAPARAGTFPITITAKNGTSPIVKQVFLLYLGTPPTITSPAQAQLVQGAAGSFTISTAGYPAADITESGNLPTGVSLTDNGDGTATLSGTPAATTAGTYSITVTASNGLTPATQTLGLTVLQAAPTATTAVLAGTTSVTRHYGTFTFTQPLANIAVHLVAAGTTTDAVAPAVSASNGWYEFDGVTPRSYQVEYVDPAGAYTTQWYSTAAGGAASRAGASSVTVTAGTATTTVNATLVAATK